MNTLQFIGKNKRWLAAGALLTAGSTFGQTYFIALFGAQIRAAFELSHGDFGFLYMAATLASALTLVQLGRLADHMRLKTLGLATIFGLSIATGLMWLATSITGLVLALYCLRLAGQGMMSHVALTAMARWFNAFRGRAISLASLGHAIGESVIPATGVAVTAVIGWKYTWGLAGLALVLLIAPMFFALTRIERKPASRAQQTDTTANAGQRHWQRHEVLRDWRFYILLLGTFSNSFIGTVTFFHQAHLVAEKGWNMVTWAGFYPFFAGAAIFGSLAAGWAIDIWSARKLMPVYFLPMVASMVVFAYGNAPFTGLMAMVLIGLTTGASQATNTAVWAEMYGTWHLGSIKSLTTAISVLGSAIGPGLTGFLLDRAVTINTIFLLMAVHCVVISIVFAVIQPALKRQRDPTDF